MTLDDVAYAAANVIEQLEERLTQHESKRNTNIMSLPAKVTNKRSKYTNNRKEEH